MTDKSVLRDAILAQLEADLSTLTAAAQSSREEATDSENKQEGKFDMRAQSAAYLAAGQTQLASELRAAIAAFRTLPTAPFPEDATVALGALVTLDMDGQSACFLLGPARGGLEVACGQSTITVVTAASPFGRQMLGRKAGDSAGPGRRIRSVE
ncbi:MAG: transcription elongation factor [Opitutaceae bacterium]